MYNGTRHLVLLYPPNADRKNPMEAIALAFGVVVVSRREKKTLFLMGLVVRVRWLPRFVLLVLRVLLIVLFLVELVVLLVLCVLLVVLLLVALVVLLVILLMAPKQHSILLLKQTVFSQQTFKA